MEMSERREKRKVEFIESYWTGGEYGSDYKWNDNHGELIRCKDCKHRYKGWCCAKYHVLEEVKADFFCADGTPKDS